MKKNKLVFFFITFVFAGLSFTSCGDDIENNDKNCTDDRILFRCKINI
ncbi:hypothetical protein GGR21_001493 [Dysgonomonas hofstadii]|uniref:Lipoprotein n=1 Tax=Dysgonomonas hofstadii TaxID=637886 RepID=A0A840CI08_9BACT|nr:hypothetical protein [Dysgonomonas hofstadii]